MKEEKPEHDEIFLIDLGDGDLAWCDEQFPSNGIHGTDSVSYTRTDLIKQAKLDVLDRINEAFSLFHGDDLVSVSAVWDSVLAIKSEIEGNKE